MKCCVRCGGPYYAKDLCDRHYHRSRTMKRAEIRLADTRRHVARLQRLLSETTDREAAAAIRWALTQCVGFVRESSDPSLTGYPVEEHTRQ